MSGAKKQKAAGGEARTTAANNDEGGAKRKEQKGGKPAQPKGKQEAKKAPAPKAEAKAPKAAAAAAPKKPAAGGAPSKKAPKKEEKEETKEESEGEAEEEVSAELKAVQDAQKGLDDLYELQDKEVHAIEMKYMPKRKPFYTQRAAAIAKVPGFWAQAFTQHELLGSLVEQGDEELLKALQTFEVTENADYKTGFQIHFTFGPNPVISNTKVTREYKVTQSPDGKDVSVTFDVVPKVQYKNKKWPAENPECFFKQWFGTDEECLEIAEALREQLWRDPMEALNGPGPSDLSDDDDEGAVFGGDDDDEAGDE